MITKVSSAKFNSNIYTRQINNKKSENRQEVSFGANSVEKMNETAKILYDIIGSKFIQKGDSQLVSEAKFPIYSAKHVNGYLQDVILRGKQVLKSYTDNKDINNLVDGLYELSLLEKLIFMGSEGNFVLNPKTQKFESSLAYTLLDKKKLDITWLENSTKVLLKDKIDKSNNNFIVTNGKEKFLINSYEIGDSRFGKTMSITIDKVLR